MTICHCHPGFAEIIRAIFQWQALGPITNGANMITQIPTFNNFNITDSSGKVVFYLSSFFPMLIMIICVPSSSCSSTPPTAGLSRHPGGRDRRRSHGHQPGQAQDALLLHLFLLRRSGGRLFAMFVNNAQAKVYTSTMTYEILLIVVIGGIGSISGSCLAPSCMWPAPSGGCAFWTAP